MEVQSVEKTEIRKGIPDMKVLGEQTPGVPQTLMPLNRVKFG